MTTYVATIKTPLVKHPRNKQDTREIPPHWLTAHDHEQHWRSKGEQSIREEMEQAMARYWDKKRSPR